MSELIIWVSLIISITGLAIAYFRWNYLTGYKEGAAAVHKRYKWSEYPDTWDEAFKEQLNNKQKE